jgi:hypothetical protein
MEMFHKAPFKKFVKKQTRPLQLIIEDEVEKIANNPDLGEMKKGDLAGFRVQRFLFRSQTFLIAYCMQGKDLFFYKIGPHENFYRELKKYVKEV